MELCTFYVERLLVAERFMGRGDKRRRYGGERVLRCVFIHMLKNGVSSWGIEIDRCRDPLPLVPLVGGCTGGVVRKV